MSISRWGDDVVDFTIPPLPDTRRKFKRTHLAGVDLLAAEGVVVGTHLDGGCADEVSVGVG